MKYAVNGISTIGWVGIAVLVIACLNPSIDGWIIGLIARII